MAWEERGSGSNKYFYRSIRTPHGVRKEYMGCGSEAETLSKRLDAERAAAAADRAAITTEYTATEQSRDLTAELEDMSDLLLELTLYANGFWRGRNYGKWRRRREP